MKLARGRIVACQRPPGIGDGFEDAGGTSLEHLAPMSERHAPAGSGEQRRPDRAFKCLDRFRHRRLRDRQLTGRS
jgi:hypothetical protein